MGRVSERVAHAVAPFGPGALIAAASPPDPAAAADRLARALEDTPGVALVTGPSGAGKSTFLGALGRTLAARGVPVIRADAIRVRRDRVVAALEPGTVLDDWLSVLSRAGLADARLFATRAGDLSAGESARLRLALAMARAARTGAWLVCDEFASLLDRDTAAGVASSVHKWAGETGARIVAATAHADMVRLLGPSTLVNIERSGRVSIAHGPGRVRAPRIRIEPGTMDDYRVLAPMHYRSAWPASVCRILRAVVPGAEGRRLAGVLVVSYPTLNGAWREMVWPGRYVATLPDRAKGARRLNREVRRLTRAIVDPRDRGRGIATGLVRAYLDDPATPATEAVSAMGRFSPFAASAGMTAYALPPRPADDRLADMLDAMGLEPWELFDRERVESLRGARDGAWLARELRTWEGAVRSSIPKALRDPRDILTLAPLAAARLIAPPRAYAHVMT